MAKPTTQDGYSAAVTESCERVLVTLLHGLGPWKRSVYLVGGLVPRYLIPDRPPAAPAHAGTGDVDIVVALEMLAETEAYHTVEENLKKMGFERGENDAGQKVSWRWKARIDEDTIVILELLADNPEVAGGRVKPLPTEGRISALNIPHASMVFDHHLTQEITAALLGDGGMAIETIRFADLVSFTCLKALALDDRGERKDAHDLVYCIEHWPGGPEAVAALFREARKGKHAAVIDRALGILRTRFTDDKTTEGYLKDGPVAVALFEPGGFSDADREVRLLRQRNVSELVTEVLAHVG